MRVTFRVVVEGANEAAAYFVCGSPAWLGAWKAERAARLKRTEEEVAGTRGRVYTLTLDVDPAADVAEAAPDGKDAGEGKGAEGAKGPEALEYKLLRRWRGAPKGEGKSEEWAGEPEWQSGGNSSFTLAYLGGHEAAEQVVHSTWRDWAAHTDGTAVIGEDPWLEPHADDLRRRYARYAELRARIERDGGGMDAFSRGYERFGFNRREAGAGGEPAGIVFREWAPGASALSLVGDFNSWNVDACPCSRDDFGVWECFLPDTVGDDGAPREAISHRSHVKVSLVTPSGERVMRVPAWVRFAVLDAKAATYCGVYWHPPPAEQYEMRHERPGRVQVPRAPSGADGGAGGAGGAGATEGATDAGKGASASGGAGATATATATATAGAGGYDGLRVYEAHVGMASEDGKVASYAEFTRDVLPRVAGLGYNCVQLMAIMEHAYYASFGYHVTNFFAAASRCGPPEDLKRLVDAAHGMGLLVIMDCVHSHASKNVEDGLGMFDGTDYQYFHAGGKGHHSLWDSRIFDYGKLEVQRFLLSNLRWWVQEYRFDGFRFDGVTSMLYTHHGIGTGFTGRYGEYFDEGAVDGDAVAYLMLANELLHDPTLLGGPPVVTIAEDVSGMPTLGAPVAQGGVGFDYRLAMAIPDMWIKLLKESTDDAWEMGSIVHTLTNRRHQEKTIAYAESHDQALVGDKTLAFWLMDKEMYDSMTILAPRTPVIDRGIALHKIIRIITFALGGEGYLCFMGNEFGHPEWIDFPREGNGESFHHCRRQWHLAEDALLRYSHLNNWDKAMQRLEAAAHLLTARDTYVSLKHEGDKVIVFEKAGLVFVVNLHPTKSFTDYAVGVPRLEKYSVCLSSDEEHYGGFGNVTKAARVEHFARNESQAGRPHSMLVYAPCRTCVVYAPESRAAAVAEV